MDLSKILDLLVVYLNEILDLLALTSWRTANTAADIDPAKQLAWSVLGGFLAAVAFALCAWLYTLARAKWWRGAFKQVFGPDVARAGEFHLVYTSYNLPPVYKLVDGEEKEIQKPYRKPGAANYSFSIEEPTSGSEIRAFKYLGETIGAQLAVPPSLSTDYELAAKMDLSFVSLGSQFSNVKTEDALHNEGNSLIDFAGGWFVSRSTQRRVPGQRAGDDYAILLKIHPTQFATRTWIACAGYGEWGTSGAAYHLAHHWHELSKYAGEGPFVMLLRVRRGKDESTEQVLRARTPEELEEEIDRLEAEAANAPA